MFCGLQGLSIWLFQLMPVSYALALFQLGGVVNVYLGHKIFGESSGWQRLVVSLIMLVGAAFIILG
jgi:drug/metabolite transporter (DMT)-like permease